jgi:hypothetical protein
LEDKGKNLLVNIENLYYDYRYKNKVTPNELYIDMSNLNLLTSFCIGRFGIYKDTDEIDYSRFMGMQIITNPNPQEKIELKVSYNPLSDDDF